MKRFVLQAGAWTAFGLLAAFAVVSANSGHRRIATVTPAAKATVAAVSVDARETKVAPATVAATKPAPRAQVARRTATKSAQPVGVMGQVVAIDEQTGELGMPSAAQLAELQAAQQILPTDELNRSDVGLTPEHRANGSTFVNLQGRFQEFATVSVGPNGHLKFDCADGATHGSPSAAPAVEEK